jgi:hypothetical protein
MYDGSGRLVRNIVNGANGAGIHTTVIPQIGLLAKGVYFLKLETESGTIATKAILLK